MAYRKIQFILRLTLATMLLQFSAATGLCQSVTATVGAIAPADDATIPADQPVAQIVFPSDPASPSLSSAPQVSQSAMDLEPSFSQRFDRTVEAQILETQAPAPPVTSAPVTSAPNSTRLPPTAPTNQSSAADQLDLNPQIIEDSPVLQRWLEEIPDVRSEIHHDPSFRTRLRLGYTQFPSNDRAGGLSVGVEDIFVGRTGLTVSGAYQGTFDGSRETYGGDLRYYVLPLGSYINVAPSVGYGHVAIDSNTTDGINLGVRLLLSLSRTGAADIALSQSWVAPGTDREVGISTLSFGYALTHHLRISTDLQKQNSPNSKDSRVGIVLEWML